MLLKTIHNYPFIITRPHHSLLVNWKYHISSEYLPLNNKKFTYTSQHLFVTDFLCIFIPFSILSQVYHEPSRKLLATDFHYTYINFHLLWQWTFSTYEYILFLLYNIASVDNSISFHFRWKLKKQQNKVFPTTF